MDSKFNVETFLTDLTLRIEAILKDRWEDYKEEWCQNEDEETPDLEDYLEECRTACEPYEICEDLSDIEDDYKGTFRDGAEKFVFVPDDPKIPVIKFLWTECCDNQSELDVFSAAKSSHVEDYFAAAWNGGSLNILGMSLDYYFQENIPCKCMDRIRKDNICDGSSNETKNRRSTRNFYSKYSLGGNSYSFVEAISIFGFSDSSKLLRFLEGEGINDLHSGNWQIFKGKVKLIDYGGF